MLSSTPRAPSTEASSSGLAQALDALRGGHRATAPLEAERAGDDPDRQRADTASDLGHDGCRARAGATTLAGGDEDHVGALEGLLELVPVLLGGVHADVGVAPGAQAAGQLATDVDLDVGVTHEQRLRVGVDRQELDALQPGVDHAVDGVDAGTTDADDLDHCQVVLWGTDHERRLLRVTPLGNGDGSWSRLRRRRR